MNSAAICKLLFHYFTCNVYIFFSEIIMTMTAEWNFKLLRKNFTVIEIPPECSFDHCCAYDKKDEDNILDLFESDKNTDWVKSLKLNNQVRFSDLIAQIDGTESLENDGSNISSLVPTKLHSEFAKNDILESRHVSDLLSYSVNINSPCKSLCSALEQKEYIIRESVPCSSKSVSTYTDPLISFQESTSSYCYDEHSLQPLLGNEMVVKEYISTAAYSGNISFSSDFSHLKKAASKHLAFLDESSNYVGNKAVYLKNPNQMDALEGKFLFPVSDDILHSDRSSVVSQDSVNLEVKRKPQVGEITHSSDLLESSALPVGNALLGKAQQVTELFSHQNNSVINYEHVSSIPLPQNQESGMPVVGKNNTSKLCPQHIVCPDLLDDCDKSEPICNDLSVIDVHEQFEASSDGKNKFSYSYYSY